MTDANIRNTHGYRPLALIGAAIFIVIILCSVYLAGDASSYIYSSAMTVVTDTNVAEVNMSELKEYDESDDETELVAKVFSGNNERDAKRNLGTRDEQSILLNKVGVEEGKRTKIIGLVEVENALKLAKLDAFGQLIVNADSEASLSRVVARLPSAMGEEEIEQIQRLIKLSLPGESGEQVADVLIKYYRYKEIEQSMVLDSEQPGSMKSALEQLTTMAQVRTEIMGQQFSEDLFGMQQRRAEYYLERGIIEQDKSISIEVRELQLAHLKSAAEKQGQTFVSSSEEIQALNDEIADMRVSGQSEHQVLARRVEQLGDGAALQLAAMDSQKDEWQVRYQSFNQEKQLILASVLGVADQQSQIDDLFQRHYSIEELAGARAYDNQFAP